MAMLSSNGYHAPQAQPPMGACCACGKEDQSVVNIVTINREAPVSGTGWMCVPCGLPADGALAVVCSACIASQQPLRFVIYGPLGNELRLGVDDFPNTPFDHDFSKHPKGIPWRGHGPG